MIDYHNTVVNVEYVIIPVAYLTAGFITVNWINRRGDSIIDMLEEVGIGAKGQGIAYAFLVFTWPIWVFLAMRSMFSNYFEKEEGEE